MSTDPTHRRGDIWIVDFGLHPEDPEQALRRPALIVSDDHLHHPNLRIAIVIPGTSTLRQLAIHVVVEPDHDNGLHRATAFQVEQVRAVSTARLVEPIGRVDATTGRTVDDTLRSVLRLD